MASHPEQGPAAEAGESIGLNDRDLELVLQQCELQHATSPEQIAGMTEAFGVAKRLAMERRDVGMRREEILGVVAQLAELVEPQQNPGGARRLLPVTFADGSLGEHPDTIETAMRAWAGAFADQSLTPAEYYYEYEKIHPHNDGNGRVGHCLWAMSESWQYGQWPVELPPDVFADDYRAPQRRSAFGEIEQAD